MVLAAMDERLSSYALIARAAIHVAIPLLTRLFSERFAQLKQVVFIFIIEGFLCWEQIFSAHHNDLNSKEYYFLQRSCVLTDYDLH